MDSYELLDAIGEMLDRKLDERFIIERKHIQDMFNKSINEFEIRTHALIEQTYRKLSAADSKLSAAIEHLDSKLSAADNRLSAAIEHLDSKFNTAIEHMDSKLSAVDNKLSAAIEYMDSKLSAAIEHMDSKLSAVDNRLSAAIEQTDNRLSAAIEQTDRNLRSYIKNEVIKRIDLLSEAHEIIARLDRLEYLPDKVDDMKLELSSLKIAFKEHIRAQWTPASVP